MTAPRRVFYVPNEIGDALQSGYRRAYADLVRTGMLDEVEVFSLERRIRAGGDAAGHRADLIAAVDRFRPDLLHMQHLGATGLGPADFTRLLARRPAFLYQEADPYSRWLHPLPRASAQAARVSDITWTVGAGTFTRNLQRAGARRVEWTPSVFDPARIDVGVGATTREFDVVVVANRNRARVRPLPSAQDRVRFVERLQAAPGAAVAVFGKGWAGPTAHGPIGYSEQSGVLRSAWMSANWDHFATEPCYFSDRLAIALASGSIHATTLHPGHRAVFPASTASFLITGASPSDLVERIHDHLHRTSPDQRLEAESAARAFAWDRLRQDDHLVVMLNSVGAAIDGRAARDAWDLTAAGLAQA